MQNQGLGKNFLLGSWAFFSFQSRQVFQSWACIKSFYPIALESCLILISGSDCLCESVLHYEVFLNVPKIDLYSNLFRVLEHG